MYIVILILICWGPESPCLPPPRRGAEDVFERFVQGEAGFVRFGNHRSGRSRNEAVKNGQFGLCPYHTTWRSSTRTELTNMLIRMVGIMV